MRSMPVWVIVLISLILSAVGIVTAIASGSFGSDAMSLILGLVFNVLLFWIANNIKKEAGR